MWWWWWFFVLLFPQAVALPPSLQIRARVQEAPNAISPHPAGASLRIQTGEGEPQQPQLSNRALELLSLSQKKQQRPLPASPSLKAGGGPVFLEKSGTPMAGSSNSNNPQAVLDAILLEPAHVSILQTFIERTYENADFAFADCFNFYLRYHLDGPLTWSNIVLYFYMYIHV